MAASDPPVLEVIGPVARADLEGLCARARDLLEQRGDAVVVCEISTVNADAVAVDALARLQLLAQRRSCRIRFRGASPELLDLAAFMGLGAIFAD